MFKIVLLVVILVYNSEVIFLILVECVGVVFGCFIELEGYELILVEDCSCDGSWKVIECICKE